MCIYIYKFLAAIYVYDHHHHHRHRFRRRSEFIYFYCWCWLFFHIIVGVPRSLGFLHWVCLDSLHLLNVSASWLSKLNFFLIYDYACVKRMLYTYICECMYIYVLIYFYIYVSATLLTVGFSYFFSLYPKKSQTNCILHRSNRYYTIQVPLIISH